MVRLSPPMSSGTSSSNTATSDKKALKTSIPLYRPGQWVDLFLPGLNKPGGFTITSSPPISPSSLSASHLELAIQKSPRNPAAAYLWRPKSEILGEQVGVRVGGSFVFPPKVATIGNGAIAGKKLKRVIFVAGGVGINPFMSMLSYIRQMKKDREGGLGFRIVLLYASKNIVEDDGEVLFLNRLRDVFGELGEEGDIRLFLTGRDDSMHHDSSYRGEVKIVRRRIHRQDLLDALGTEEGRDGTVCYICGVPTMTDEFVAFLKEQKGMGEQNVLCERWW